MEYPTEDLYSYGTVHVKNVVRKITLHGIPMDRDSVLAAGPFINHRGVKTYLTQSQAIHEPTAVEKPNWGAVLARVEERFDPLLMTVAVIFHYE